MTEILWNKLYLAELMDVAKELPEEADRTTFIDVRGLISKDDPINNWDHANKLADMIHFLVQRFQRVIVFCNAGWDRSPLVVAVYLAKYCVPEYDPEDHTENSKIIRVEQEDGIPVVASTETERFTIKTAYDYISLKRPMVRCHTSWLEPLTSYETSEIIEKAIDKFAPKPALNKGEGEHKLEHDPNKEDEKEESDQEEPLDSELGLSTLFG